MELPQQGAGSGGGPAPFLQKTYDMVEDAATNTIVSWGSKKNTFVVWDQVEFARGLLPTYFKHDNFSSFIRQLNTYGFRKVDQEKWEFSNEDFVRGEKQRLRNIRRRKPIHSHTQSSERASMEEEIDRLYKERDRLGDDLTRFGNLELWSGSQLQETERRVDGVTRRLEKLSNFVENAVRDPSFVEHLAAIDFSAFSKKRRFLGKGDVLVLENGSNGVPSRGSITPKLKLNHLFPQDFSNKLKLELCPAALDETRSSNGSRGCSPERAVVGAEALEDPVVELLNTTVPLCQKRSNSLSWLSIDEEEEQNVSCQLKLALASSPLHLDEAETSDSKSYKSTTSSNAVKDASFHGGAKSGNGASIANTTNQGNVAATGRVNDKFWEQFLTERPGSLGNEEASSCSRSSAKDERITGGRETWMKTNDVGAMKL